MYALIAGMLLVASADLAVKQLLRRSLGAQSLSLGAFGCVRLVESRMFLAREAVRPRVPLLWGVWLCSGALLSVVAAAIPATGAFAGLLLGGAGVHAIETTRKGRVCDYVCLKFWPAFDGADVAITVGAAGLTGTALRILFFT